MNKLSKMNRKRVFALLYVVSLMSFSFVFVGNGCSKSFSTQAVYDDFSSFGLDVAETPIDYIPGKLHVGTVYSKQVLDQFTHCAGVEFPSDDTLRMYDSKKGAISEFGNADTITSPMFMAIISIAGEVCSDLIQQEINAGSNARIFKGWNLAGATLPTSSAVNESITRLANSCWQRNETSDERMNYQDLVFSVQNGEAGAVKKSALMLCTGVLSSLDSILK